VQEAVLFLKGRTHELIRKIRAQMDAASEACEFEKAARLRDKLFALERTVEKQIAVATDFQDRDVFAAAVSGGAAVITCFSVRAGFVTGTRHFPFPETMASEDEMLGAFIRQYYGPGAFVPGEIFVSHLPEDAGLIEEGLCASRGQKVRLTRPERGEKARVLDMARRNAAHELRNRIQARTSERDLLGRLQKRLALGRLPRRIECFDNSTLMGSEPVAGMVVFVDGRPEKSAYRRFLIQTVGIPDDYAAMSEVLKRRFGQEDPAGVRPDLVMLDGGRGQLGIGLAAMRELGLTDAFDIISIAKKDERRGETQDKVFVPNRVNPVGFGREGDLRLFLQRVRDEAHRFAVTFHRRRRRKATLTSALDGIRGIGPVRKAALVKHFGSMEAIRAARIEELSALPGFNRQMAETIEHHLRANFDAQRST
jgi:excinuclease ABC subunit C